MVVSFLQNNSSLRTMNFVKLKSNFTKYYKNTNVFKLSKRQVSLWLTCLTASCGSKNGFFNSWNFCGNQPLLQQCIVVSFRECLRVDAMVAFLLIHLRILDFQANAESMIYHQFLTSNSKRLNTCFTNRTFLLFVKHIITRRTHYKMRTR